MNKRKREYHPRMCPKASHWCRKWPPTLEFLPESPMNRGAWWATMRSQRSDTTWRRKWQPTPVFLPGESQGWRSLVGCRLWGRTESDTTEAT